MNNYINDRNESEAIATVINEIKADAAGILERLKGMRLIDAEQLLKNSKYYLKLGYVRTDVNPALGGTARIAECLADDRLSHLCNYKYEPEIIQQKTCAVLAQVEGMPLDKAQAVLAECLEQLTKQKVIFSFGTLGQLSAELMQTEK